MKFGVFANAALLGLMLMPLAHAQLMFGLKANIPFEFRVGDTTLRAGDYSLARNALGNKVLIMRNLDHKSGATVFNSIRTQTRLGKDLHASSLVFHRYGKIYFLSQVWEGYGASDGLQVSQSKAERIIAHQMASLRKPETIEIALLSFHPQKGTN